MKTIPFTLINKKALQKFKDDVENKDSIILSAAEFVKEIENGNLNAIYKGEEQEKIKEDKLASSLISMRNQMKRIAQEESERKWVTEGLAKFVDILRSNSNIFDLSDSIIRNIVTYLNANQGLLLLLMDENPQDVHLQATGCYAYDRKKFIEKRIDIGDGITGQSVLEKETIYITDIPKNYIHITSGLGEAAPTNVLIVPLKVNEVVYGVLEIASFQKLAKYQIEFVEKLSESIASSISSVRTNERTKKLLEETQMQAEQMRAQEEEMRQNMEELSATQEEMQRSVKRTESILGEIQEKERYLDELINVPKDTIFTIDRDYKIVSFNKALATAIEAMGIKLEKGFDLINLFPTEKERERQRALYDRAFNGENFEHTDSFGEGDQIMYHVSNLAPLYDSNGNVFAVANFTKDVTAMIKAQKQLEQREKVFNLTTILSESDTFGNILLVNNKLCEVSKYKEEELIGKSHNIFRHPEMPKDLFRLFWETIKSGKEFKGIIKNKAKDGSHYWVDATIVPIKDDNGKTIKYIGARYHIADDDLAEELYNKQAKRLGHPLLKKSR